MSKSSHRALVVDDESVIRKLVTRALSRRGFECDTAENGAEALGMALTNVYDVIVSDMRMPHLQGNTLATALLSNDERPVIVVLTGDTNSQHLDDLTARGIDAILFKPFDPELLGAKVKELVMQRASACRP
jgi:DNA-binding response OmpR family regulator